ncbi:phosphoadenosine phosphosulfate reductase family protein [uncultured Tissierella sp.]|uniref:phosphoadenosine phosphosulfate reductase domain-containing protein n=1 Tax=uncultured Tissierella sp. TaxID=448160 RepID=UPI0028058806|nr:phosphoadenosine phosphosulfate reductase family protein [uncultured Tissierella sp.]MDU5080246.1 phosphoadenosine phosphosulfate reductase family protein [Bacillota bacterium]
MAIKRCEASIDVVKAAEIRITNVFRNGLPVYMSFSGGKDSICLAQLVFNLIQRGKINPGQLTVQFIDEEAIFPCIEKTVLNWRKKFMLLGAKFEWFCLEVKHFNCFNELSNDESFICWDSEKEDVWVRRPPSFAIRSHPLLRPRKDAYQDFLPRTCSDGITLTGVRVAESVQRLMYIASSTKTGKNITGRRQIYPIYDWTNKDVWLYLKNQKVDIPDIYLYLWQSGSSKSQLRVSQFFSIDTARSLVKMNEYYPDLMERIIRREPNAYLAALYWDSEMFGRRSRNRREIEKGEAKKDYEAELIKMFSNMDFYFATKHKMNVANKYKNFFLQVHTLVDQEGCRQIYEGLISGDPKSRTLRALYQIIYGSYIEEAKKIEKGENLNEQ